MQIIKNANQGARGAESSDESECDDLDDLHMADIAYKYESSICSSSSDGSQSNRLTPVPDDANSNNMPSIRFYQFLFPANWKKNKAQILFFAFAVFLTEVIDSLERGYKEKTKADYLILEINSSRYAYNMSLSEVNFYVVKALLNLYPIKESDGNVLSAFNQIFAQLHGVLKNYIRGPDAMIDCLKAIEVHSFFSHPIYVFTHHPDVC